MRLPRGRLLAESVIWVMCHEAVDHAFLGLNRTFANDYCVLDPGASYERVVADGSVGTKMASGADRAIPPNNQRPPQRDPGENECALINTDDS